MSQVEQFDIVALGELLMEFVPSTFGQPLRSASRWLSFPSGAVGIFAAGAAALGARVAMHGAISQDPFSSALVHAMNERGVDTRFLQTVPDRATGLAFVEYSEDSRRYYYYRKDSAGSSFGADDLDPALIAHSKLLHYAGMLMFMSSNLRAACLRAVELAQANGTLVSFDPNLRPGMTALPEDLDLIRHAVRTADFVQATQEEAQEISGTQNPEAALRWLLECGPKLVAVKLGAEGCLLGTPETILHCEGYKVAPVDPTGAGDVFAAALCVGVLAGWDLSRIGLFANAAGALQVSRRGLIGATLPTPSRIQRLMKKQQPKCHIVS